MDLPDIRGPLYQREECVYPGGVPFQAGGRYCGFRDHSARRETASHYRSGKRTPGCGQQRDQALF